MRPAADSLPLVTTRLSLHRLAAEVISPVRQRATGGRIALEARLGGFGTHPLPAGGWAGVRGTDLIVVAPTGAERTEPITSLRAAAFFVGAPDALTLPDDPLVVDPGSAARLADAFAGGTQALASLVAEASAADDASRIDLWPEHFDVAITLGDESTGARATYGVSPGDDDHAEPYAYVGPWTMPQDATGWSAVGFSGAETPFTGAADTLAFFRDRRDALAAG